MEAARCHRRQPSCLPNRAARSSGPIERGPNERSNRAASRAVQPSAVLSGHTSSESLALSNLSHECSLSSAPCPALLRSAHYSRRRELPMWRPYPISDATGLAPVRHPPPFVPPCSSFPPARPLPPPFPSPHPQLPPSPSPPPPLTSSPLPRPLPPKLPWD